MKVRRATDADVPALVALFEELERMQKGWRVFTPRPGFYDEVGAKYRASIGRPDHLVLAAEEGSEVVGMAYAEPRTPSRFSDERALELSGLVVRSDFRGRGVGRRFGTGRRLVRGNGADEGREGKHSGRALVVHFVSCWEASRRRRCLSLVSLVATLAVGGGVVWKKA